jgi:hypothetical protein
MRFHRKFNMLARWVLTWLLLSIGVAVASPLMQSTDYTLVCSGIGMVKLQSNSGDAGGEVRMLECPLCSPFFAPPPVIDGSKSGIGNVAVNLPQQLLAEITVRSAAPFPARGPPRFFGQSGRVRLRPMFSSNRYSQFV